jgi:hypothetical protein
LKGFEAAKPAWVEFMKEMGVLRRKELEALRKEIQSEEMRVLRCKELEAKHFQLRKEKVYDDWDSDDSDWDAMHGRRRH